MICARRQYGSINFIAFIIHHATALNKILHLLSCNHTVHTILLKNPI
jgi:hypothetical protein